MDNLCKLVGIRRVARIRNEHGSLYGVKTSVQRYLDESLFEWYGHVECMTSDRLVKNIHLSPIFHGGCIPGKMHI